ncbi:MAG: hypothetical protein ACJ79A_03680 [Gemmatimonadaceae bacterium]
MTHPDSTSRTPRGFALAPLLAASMLGPFAPRIAAAQSDAPDCVAIIAEMLTPSPSAGAIRASAGCPSSGPVTLANRWTRREARSATERAALVEASSLMRDARIYDAVLGMTRDESRPLADRLAGIRVLLGYADNGHMVMQQGQARDAEPAAPAARSTASSGLVRGSVAFTPDMRSDVKRELYRLANVDHDPDVRYAAQKASQSLGYVVPGQGRVAPTRAP